MMEIYFLAMEINILLEKDLVKLIISVIKMISGIGKNGYLPIINISMLKSSAFKLAIPPPVAIHSSETIDFAFSDSLLGPGQFFLFLLLTK